MKRKKIFIGLLVALVGLLVTPKKAQATKLCTDVKYGYPVTGLKSDYPLGVSSIDFTVANLSDHRSYTLYYKNGGGGKNPLYTESTGKNTSIKFFITETVLLTGKKKKHLFLGYTDSVGNEQTCKIGSYDIKSNGECNILVNQGDYFSENPRCISAAEGDIDLNITNMKVGGKTYEGSDVKLFASTYASVLTVFNGSTHHVIPIDKLGKSNGQSIDVFINYTKDGGLAGQNIFKICGTTIEHFKPECSEEDREETGAGEEQQKFELCKQVPAESSGACTDCYNKDGLWTSLGCISRTNTQDIVGKLMTIGISIAGGIALLMILAAAFILSTSEGEPKRTSEAKEMLTHAIIGLLFIIFSITILEFIGVKILHIPEFGG